VTIAKGRPWGTPGALPDGGVVVHADIEARHVIEAARSAGRPLPVLGLLGGDLCRTLGGTGDEGRLRGEGGVTFPVDLGIVIADGHEYCFVAHLVARNRWWTRATLAMNCQWLGDWNVAPQGHPNDGVLDTFEVRLRRGERRQVRSRLPLGSHLPHPGIRARRAAEAHWSLDPATPLWLDGERLAGPPVRDLTVRAVPDAVTVVV